jgi:DNA-binding NarL/FixJ family response regulator
VERLRREDFGVAFVDVRMPVMNGVESFLEIRKLRPSAKVVMMSGYDEGLVAKAFDNGALGFSTSHSGSATFFRSWRKRPKRHSRSSWS